MANASVHHWFGLRDNETAQVVSNLCGIRSVPTYSGTPRMISGSTARSLTTPDEVRRIEGIITFIDGRHPVKVILNPYYSNPDMVGLHDPNPYYKPQGIDPTE